MLRQHIHFAHVGVHFPFEEDAAVVRFLTFVEDVVVVTGRFAGEDGRLVLTVLLSLFPPIYPRHIRQLMRC